VASRAICLVNLDSDALTEFIRRRICVPTSLFREAGTSGISSAPFINS
jgi:hypothetical protein